MDVSASPDQPRRSGRRATRAMSWTPLTVSRALARNAASAPAGEALVFKQTRVAWAELDAWSDRLARSLLATGVARGQAVATFMPNCLEWVALFCALAKIGAVIVPINFRYKAAELADVLKGSDATMLFATTSHGERDHIDTVTEAMALAPLDRFVGLGAGPLPELRDASSFAAFEALGDGVPAVRVAAAQALVEPDDVLIIQYTSGTTASPKGVQLRQDQVLRSGTAMSGRMAMGRGDRFFSPMPFFHIGGSTASLLNAVASGATLCFVDYFTPGEALAIIAAERCTHLCGLDTMFVDMLAHRSYASLDLTSVRTGWTIYNKAVFEAFPGMMSVYALSECSSTVAISHASDPLEQRRDTCGRPFDGIDVRILDPRTNAEQPAGTPGRIVVRGWCTTLGYYKQPELNAQLFIDGDWLDTGDYGTKTATGEIRYLGRLKDVLRVGGENVASVEVEAVINAHPAVLRSAIVPVGDARLGEVPCAFVQLRDGLTLAPDALIEHCRLRLARFKLPRHVVFVAEFAMTASGKIQKVPLAAQARASFGAK